MRSVEFRADCRRVCSRCRVNQSRRGRISRRLQTVAPIQRRLQNAAAASIQQAQRQNGTAAHAARLGSTPASGLGSTASARSRSTAFAASAASVTKQKNNGKSARAYFPFFRIFGRRVMKIITKILTALALIILFAGEVEAADLQIDSGKNFVEQKRLIPPRLRRPQLPQIPPKRTPRKDYTPRLPVRPTPRHLPNLPKTTHDKRGGSRKNFGPPQNPHR